ncbi:hypothetical protein M2451_004126 [Dysgonomonas sp. PFB1-18]|nr:MULTISPECIES: hypothetical protein [unclassified Dysgonomonas]MDH6311195.1 hypothetical protein [Dysgonomonas sp. PF1-14]MDH6341071.1 hypothetical protein [Dysgonomonas sp. PF1-16]MDH6382776.1 hypothetical protein [Dysgonomonas sp. PFB1-18]MDH6400067.1 hypothetical protein [Dysgonomonas sp. PF1-23]
MGINIFNVVDFGILYNTLSYTLSDTPFSGYRSESMPSAMKGS